MLHLTLYTWHYFSVIIIIYLAISVHACILIVHVMIAVSWHCRLVYIYVCVCVFKSKYSVVVEVAMGS